jgi:hypothetical protein
LPAEAAGFCGFDEAERFIALLYHEAEARDQPSEISVVVQFGFSQGA